MSGPRLRRAWRQALMLTASLTIGGATAHGQAVSLPAHVVDLQVQEYVIVAPDSAPAGYVTFTLLQSGDAQKPWPGDTARRRRDPTYDFHEIWVVRLDSAKTFSDLYIAERDRVPAPWANIVGGVGFADPPRVSNATLHLSPGVYALVCYVGSARQDPDRYHLLKGMIRRFTVTTGEGASSVPPPDLDLAVDGDSVRITGGVRAGARFVAVRNYGTLSADLSIRLIKPSHSTEDVHSWSPRSLVPPPFQVIGGVIAVPPGGTVFTTVLLESGEYLFNDKLVVIR